MEEIEVLLAIERLEEVIRENQEWVNDPFNEDFMFKRPLAKLNEFSSGRELKVGEVLEAFRGTSSGEDDLSQDCADLTTV